MTIKQNNCLWKEFKLGSCLYGEPQLDCGINLNVSSLRLNVAPWRSLGRRTVICAELKAVFTALGDQGGTATVRAACSTLQKVRQHLGPDPPVPQNIITHTMDNGARGRLLVIKRAKIPHKLFAVFDPDHRLFPYVCENKKQSRSRPHLLLPAVRSIPTSSVQINF